MGRETHGETWIGYSFSEEYGWEWEGASCDSSYEKWGAGESMKAGDCATLRLFEVCLNLIKLSGFIVRL